MSRELDRRINTALGFEEITARGFDGYPIKLRHFSTDRNACAEAEAVIVARGLGEKYAELLEQESPGRMLYVDTIGDDVIAYDVVLWIATAPPDVRCLAMLKALEEWLEAGR